MGRAICLLGGRPETKRCSRIVELYIFGAAMKTYVFAIDAYPVEYEVEVQADDEKLARKSLWEIHLSEEQKDAVASIELVDIL